jgi:hypothetical protein
MVEDEQIHIQTKAKLVPVKRWRQISWFSLVFVGV